ncbi:ABC transporter ATP-binding protein [Bacillus piscicola]|uniref:ABC transporter ATP-binding protein n=1 Tax=Bacillus piscicola TaxID=1632684 RepID=UPI001F09253D|nr:ABC transporter ATP-binding protein [Bacillus piscicola]
MKKTSKFLEVKNLGKSFGGNWAIKDINMSVNRGELLGIIGPNGAGKTTLFNMVTGFLKPTEGSISYQEKDISNLKPHKICNIGIARTFQIVKPFGNLSVLENVTIGALRYEKDVNKAKKIAHEKVKFVGLGEYSHTTASSLPLGHRKRLEMARALATDPEIIMLDEVMGGLNDEETADMMQLVKELHNDGLTIMLIEHNMHALMSLSERVVVLCYGKKLADGTPNEVSSNADVIEAYLGSDDDA